MQKIHNSLAGHTTSLRRLTMQWRIRTGLRQFAAKTKSFMALLRRPNIYRASTPERLGIIYSAPTHLSTAERLFLYALVRGTVPQRALEIGTARGGSAAIIAAAMEDNGIGAIIGVDPERRVEPTDRRYYGRFQFVQGNAP